MSSAGINTRGVNNNNPGNIRQTTIPWQGKTPGNDKSFETFDTAHNGIRALAKNTLTHFNRGADTVKKLVDKHAPPSENPTNAFIDRVANDMNVKPDQKLDMHNKGMLKSYVESVIKQENKNYEYPAPTVDAAVNDALGKPKDEL